MKNAPKVYARGGEPFDVDGYYDDVPYRFVDGTAIDAVVRGKVVRFASFEDFVQPPTSPKYRYWAGLIIAAQICVCLVSVVVVLIYYSYIPGLGLKAFGQGASVVQILPFICLGFVFLFARISFGYFACYYFFAVLLTYAVLTKASSSWEILAAAVALFLPAMFLPPYRIPLPELSIGSLRNLLIGILALSAAILISTSQYYFKMVSPMDIYLHRGEILLPTPLRYAMGIVTGALLPFAFACYAFSRQWLGAGIALTLLFLGYPITLTKMNLLAPLWLLFLLFLSMRSGPRATVLLSLLVPMVIGLLSISMVLVPGLSDHSLPIFGVFNFRLIAVPAISIELYDRFFATHPLTHYCQISVLKPLFYCPYSEQLGVVLEREYGFGTLNASLFATEGIASVGPRFVPLSVFVCGLVLAIGNACSSRLPARFVIISGGMVVLSLLNVPMSTALLTSGLGTLYLLWLVMPRAYFERSTSGT
ncbi:hypothetical protein [Bradyrhizobium japonicum]|uniref:hypothetical protein n=1 Tax=Bradyrhizobium japonicum TaxID=375 RepID=UPI002714AB21|nr:hypothetical protein [Bradyrhizobium japonicum]WLB15025.1 hypothetical protein QIH95_23425 [Bradyrhizobium japonicum]